MMKGLGVNKKKMTKNSSNNNRKKNNKKKKRVNILSKIQGIIRYLKSDSYLYSHLIRANSSTRHSMLHHKSGLERNEPMLRINEGQLKEKLMKYLKTDAYLYAPLDDVRHRDDLFLKNVISSPRAEELQFTRVTSTIVSRKSDWLTKQVAQDSIVDKRGDLGRSGPRDVHVISPPTPEIQNGKKQESHQSGRLSTTSGARVLLGINSDLRKRQGREQRPKTQLEKLVAGLPTAGVQLHQEVYRVNTSKFWMSRGVKIFDSGPPQPCIQYFGPSSLM